MTLGLKRGTVKLVPYNLKWIKLFEKEKRLLEKTFGGIIIVVEHIGSTAIKGIVAKPILDMDIAVRSLKDARGMRERFEKLGYEYRPFRAGHTKDDLKAQVLYVKGRESKRTHHAHVTVYKSAYWNNDLLFRDYLCSHQKRAEQYAKLKKKLAMKYSDNRGVYTKSKVAFILATLKMARGKH